MRVPDEVRKCVVYLGLDIPDASGFKKKYMGTGFFIRVASKKFPEAAYLYLVTAKHVANQLMGKDFLLRTNTKDGKFQHAKVLSDVRWWFHADDNTADVAIFQLGLNPGVYDFLPILSEILLTEEMRKSKGIGTGDEVFLTGLFTQHQGKTKNMPIVRTGNIAMIPDDKISTKNFGDMDAYLIEARSLGGLSGSPVFAVDRTSNPHSFYLMGLIHGHWEVDKESIIDSIVEDAGIQAGINSGIAIVTPASKILDIINCDELQKELKIAEDGQL